MAARPKRPRINIQKTLHDFSFAATNESSDGTSGDKESSDDKESKDTECKQYERSFQVKWLLEYQWLVFKDGQMFCQVCIDSNQINSFTKGSTNFRTSNIKDHIKTADHRHAIQVPILQKNQKRLIEKMNDDKEQAILVAMKTVHWLCSEDVALMKFKSLMSLLKDLDVPNIGHLTISETINYESSESVLEFVEAMSKYVESEHTSKLQSSTFISVLADESTDISVRKRLVIFAQVLDPKSMSPNTIYITNVELQEATGAAIASEIYTELDKRGVPSSKVMSLGSDGASVMTGKVKGTTGHMLRKNPMMSNIHCVAHRLALCTSQAAEKIAPLKEYQEILTNLYYYFKQSANRNYRLKEIQDILESPQLRFKEVHAVRWLSFYNALEVIYRSLDPLLTYIAEAAESDAKAKYLKKKIATYKFIGLTHVMMDIIPIVSKLSLFFQKDNTDVALIKVNIDHCLADLEKLKTTPGPHQEKLKECLVNGLFKQDHQVAACPMSDITSAATKFIDSLMENIQSRFPDTDLLSAFGILSMRPISLLGSQELETWGNDQLEVLIEKYGQPQTHIWKEEGETMSKTTEPLINPDTTRTEWKDIKPKVIAQMYPRNSMENLWLLINSYHADQYPNLLILASLALTLPVNTAGCERGFSAQNRILTSLRNRLTARTQDMLLRVKLHKNVDFKQCVALWKEKNNRKLFN